MTDHNAKLLRAVKSWVRLETVLKHREIKFSYRNIGKSIVFVYNNAYGVAVLEMLALWSRREKKRLEYSA